MIPWFLLLQRLSAGSIFSELGTSGIPSFLASGESLLLFCAFRGELALVGIRLRSCFILTLSTFFSSQDCGMKVQACKPVSV